MNLKVTYLILAGGLLYTGIAFAGPNDPHPYPMTASKNPPTHINHIVNANNRAPAYPVTARPEPRVAHHHLKHHVG